MLTDEPEKRSCVEGCKPIGLVDLENSEVSRDRISPMRLEDKDSWNEKMRELDIQKVEAEKMEFKIWCEAESGCVKAGWKEWVAKERRELMELKGSRKSATGLLD